MNVDAGKRRVQQQQDELRATVAILRVNQEHNERGCRQKKSATAIGSYYEDGLRASNVEWAAADRNSGSKLGAMDFGRKESVEGKSQAAAQ